MRTETIIVFSENSGWHEQQLLTAFAALDMRAAVVSLGDCRIGFDGGGQGLAVPGFASRLPQAAFVRAVAAGTFEEVTFRLDILHALEASGVPVINPARAIERTVDKAMTSFLLQRHTIATPRTWVCESRETAAAVVAGAAGDGVPLVLKPLFGNCGRGLQLITSADMLPVEEEINGIYYLQQFIEPQSHRGQDWRVFVVAGQAIAAMERVSPEWITNRARGGECLPAVLTPELRALAERATTVTGAAYAGVDIIRDADGNFMVLEVNSVPAWRGLQSVCDVNIAALLAASVKTRLRSTHSIGSAMPA